MSLPTTNSAPTSVDWPQLIFDADALKEPFNDIHVITTKCKVVERVYDALFGVAGKELLHSTMPLHLIPTIDHTLMSIHESVTLSHSTIQVCVNTKEVTDDVIWQVMDMVSDALVQLDGKCGTVTYGDAIQYSGNEIIEYIQTSSNNHCAH